jgi:ribosomal protein S12 methylthiotransferase
MARKPAQNPENSCHLDASKPRDSRKRPSRRLVHCISLGCPRNLVDSEVMLGLLNSEGYRPTPCLEEADAIIVNTCGFLDAARRESLDAIRSAVSAKKPGAKVIVAGCLSQVPNSALDELHDQIHCIVGPGDVEKIAAAVLSEAPTLVLSSVKSYLEQGDVPRTLSTPPHYAYCKIAEGCRKGCSYCIIPHIKGPLRSKPIDVVVQEISGLIDKGVFEIILVAQDLGDFGRDLGFSGSSGLVRLLKEILLLPKDFRLRLLYLYPDEIDSTLVGVMKSDPRVLPYLDMPVQHINDQILSAMRRSTSKKHILRTIEMLRTELPSVAIRTSLIVGFPGETESQFQELCDFVEGAGLDAVGIFAYSKEPLSSSATLLCHLDEEVKQERAQKLGAIQQSLVMKKNRQLIGKRVPVIVDGYHSETEALMVARRPCQCPEVDSIVLINDTRRVRAFGETYLAEITDISDFDLVGRIIKPINRSEWIS